MKTVMDDWIDRLLAQKLVAADRFWRSQASIPSGRGHAKFATPSVNQDPRRSEDPRYIGSRADALPPDSADIDANLLL